MRRLIDRGLNGFDRLHQFRAIADPQLKEITDCLVGAGFPVARRKLDAGVHGITSHDLDYYYAEEMALTTRMAVYYIGIAPNRRWARGWVGTLSGFGTGFLWGGLAQGTVGLVAGSRNEGFSPAYIAERRRIARCVFGSPAAVGARRRFNDWNKPRQ